MSPGRPHRWMATHPDPGNGPVDRIPPSRSAHRHHPVDQLRIGFRVVPCKWRATSEWLQRGAVPELRARRLGPEMPVGLERDQRRDVPQAVWTIFTDPFAWI